MFLIPADLKHSTDESMSGTVLSKEIINIVSKLASIQERREEIQQRMEVYEHKLGLIRGAALEIEKEEQELVIQLQQRGFWYENMPLHSQGSPPGTMAAAANATTPGMGVPVMQGDTREQLAVLLSSLFQQTPPVSRAATPIAFQTANIVKPNFVEPGLSPTSSPT